MQESLQYYLHRFHKLNRGNTKYGLAPHKPILLLSVLQGIQNNIITSNQINITPELVFLFKENWSNLVITDHVCKFSLPFFHLKGERFWYLVPKQDFESALSMKESIKSIAELNCFVLYAYLDEDLFSLMKDKVSNAMLQQFLLDRYFPETKSRFNNFVSEQQQHFNEIEDKILTENASEYRNEILNLLKINDEVELFLRGSIFKREIPKIYNYTCCISGMKVECINSISMIDACHIVPFSESYNDTITNGIPLCPNLHRAFDRGLIGIDDNYRVVISKSWRENKSPYLIKQFEGKQIILPENTNQYPSLGNLEKHRDRWKI